MASSMALRRAAMLRASVLNGRSIHSTSLARAVSEFRMPSMSPTMESGKISSWKVKEGDSFAAGDVLLTVETDKAEVDVEAQDDGIVGKIILDEKESNIQVGKTIALLAEEGDDISNLEVPADSASSSPEASSSSSSSSSAPAANPEKKQEEAMKTSSHTTSTSSTASPPAPHGTHTSGPKHSRPILPSVHRLLSEAGITDVSDLQGSGLRGQLTKGDVLKHLGRIQNAEGTAGGLKAFSEKMDKPKDSNRGTGASPSADKPAAQQKVFSGPEFRRWIASGMAAQTRSTTHQAAAPTPSYSFDDILDGYLPKSDSSSSSIKTSSASASSMSPAIAALRKDSFDEILGL